MNAWLKLALRGSVGSVLAVALATGCGDDATKSSDSDGGEPAGGSGPSSAGADQGGSDSNSVAGETSSGGTSSPGGAGEGGSSATTGGADTVGGSDTAGGADNAAGAGGGGAGGAGGAGGGDVSTSVARFCNGLSGVDDQNLTFILEVGEGADKVTFTADSFECAPADGNACSPIPLGVAVPVALYQQGDPEPWFEGDIFSEADDQWLFYTVLDTSGQLAVPSLAGETTNGDLACSEVTYDYAYPDP